MSLPALQQRNLSDILFLQELGSNTNDCTTLYCDNKGTAKLVRNPEFHKRMKHISVRHHYIREDIRE